MVIHTANPETSDLEKSYLANPYAVGVTSIQVKNSDNFSTNDRVMIGEMGQEQTEVVTVSAVNADEVTLTIGATVFEHETNAPVYVLRYDQIKIYRCTSGTTYALLATVDIDVDNASLETLYDDTTGTTAYSYKTSVYHSVSTLESSLSDAIGGSGWRRNQFGYIIDEVLTEVGDSNGVVMGRTELLGYFNDVNDDLTLNVARPYEFLRTRTTLTRTASTNYVDFPTDSNGDPSMWKFDRMDYNYIDNTTTPVTNITYTLTTIPPKEFRNKYSDNTINSTTTDDQTQEIAIDTSMNRFYFYPPFATTSGAALYLYFYKFFDRIESEGDLIETPTPRIYKLYAKAVYYRKRAVNESSYHAVSDRYFADYNAEKTRLKMADRKDIGGARSFRPASSIYKNIWE